MVRTRAPRRRRGTALVAAGVLAATMLVLGSGIGAAWALWESRVTVNAGVVTVTNPDDPPVPPVQTLVCSPNTPFNPDINAPRIYNLKLEWTVPAGVALDETYTVTIGGVALTNHPNGHYHAIDLNEGAVKAALGPYPSTLTSFEVLVFREAVPDVVVAQGEVWRIDRGRGNEMYCSP